MPNEFNNYISIITIDKKIVNDLENLFEVSEDGESKIIETRDLISFIYSIEISTQELDYEYVESMTKTKGVRGEFTNQIEDRFEMAIVSASNHLGFLIDKLFNKLILIDPQLIIECIIEEENYESVGIGYYSSKFCKLEFIDMENWDIDKLNEDEEYRDLLADQQIHLMKSLKENSI